MGEVHRAEILPLDDYEEVRERFRGRVIKEKKHRRLKLGPHVSAVFENRDSVLLQIQEMLRTERIVDDAAIQHEIDTYNELLPAEDELSITLFVEIPEREVRDQMLKELVGLEETVVLEVDGHPVPAFGERQGAAADRTTAVHYLKFKLPAAVLPAVKAGTAKMKLAIRHPRYQHEAALPPRTRSSLAADWI
jgi:hypothetical protein